MQTVTRKHILIIETEILQSETDPNHLQTSMRVLNEMTYVEYNQIINMVNHYRTLMGLLKDFDKEAKD